MSEGDQAMSRLTIGVDVGGTKIAAGAVDEAGTVLGEGRRVTPATSAPEIVAAIADLVDELCRVSPKFDALWREKDVISQGEGTKRLHHPVLGDIALEYSGFAVDGRPDLSLVVYNPVDPDVADRVRALVRERASGTAQ